jgi:hypothetical protein
MSFLKLLSPTAWLIVLGAVVALYGGGYVHGRIAGSQKCELRQLKADAKADARADKVGEETGKAAEKIRADVRQDTEESTDEAQRIVDALPATCPQQPDRLRELGNDAVEGARREVLPEP